MTLDVRRSKFRTSRSFDVFVERKMDGVVIRPRFGRPCYDGCGGIVPTQRIQELMARAEQRGEAFLPSDRVCVDCEPKHGREASVTRKPRR
jgi:hypothetical protein